MRARNRRERLRNQSMLTAVRFMLNKPSISLFGEKDMNNFPKPHDDLYHPSFVAPQMRKDFHKESTAPHPVVPRDIANHPASWDKRKPKRIPSAHQMSETMLSNRHYVLACSVFTSFIIIVMLFKLAMQVFLK